MIEQILKLKNKDEREKEFVSALGLREVDPVSVLQETLKEMDYTQAEADWILRKFIYKLKLAYTGEENRVELDLGEGLE